MFRKDNLAIEIFWFTYAISNTLWSVAHLDQAHNQGGEDPPIKFLKALEKCIGHRLKLLDTVQKIWAPLRNTSPLLVT